MHAHLIGHDYGNYGYIPPDGVSLAALKRTAKYFKVPGAFGTGKFDAYPMVTHKPGSLHSSDDTSGSPHAEILIQETLLFFADANRECSLFAVKKSHGMVLQNSIQKDSLSVNAEEI